MPVRHALTVAVLAAAAAAQSLSSFGAQCRQTQPAVLLGYGSPTPGGTVEITNLLPLGHYLLFAMVDDIPSVARIVRVRG